MLRVAQILSVLIALTLLLPSHASADWRDDLPDDLYLSGRYFWAGGYSFERPYIDETAFAELNFRLNGRYRLNPDWKLEFAYQVDGTYFEGIGRISLPASEGLLDLHWPIDSGRNSQATHTLDRLSLNYRNDDVTLDIGRQRIAWGTTLTLSFLDVFNPIRPGDPFVPEQPGTDAVRLQIATGPVAGWDILYAWFDDEGAEAFAARYHDVFGDFESGLSAGRTYGENFLAFETSGDVNDVGIRIEAGWLDAEGDGDRKPFLIAFETDYAPNSSTYLSGEVFYNGPGGDDPLEYDPNLLETGMLYPARWYAAATCSYNPGGLSSLGILGLANLSDNSWFADVSISHSLSNTSDLRIGYQHYEGHLISEYGYLPDMVYIITTSYF